MGSFFIKGCFGYSGFFFSLIYFSLGLTLSLEPILERF